MINIPIKSWTDPAIPASKKYLSRLFTHRLSARLNHDEYEVVFEIPLKKGLIEETDVVVFDKRQGWSSIMAIEICKKNEVSDMLIIARDLMEKYSLMDFYLFDEETTNWYNIKKGPLGYEISSNTMFLGVALDKLSEESRTTNFVLD